MIHNSMNSSEQQSPKKYQNQKMHSAQNWISRKMDASQKGSPVSIAFAKMIKLSIGCDNDSYLF